MLQGPFFIERAHTCSSMGMSFSTALHTLKQFNMLNVLNKYFTIATITAATIL